MRRPAVLLLATVLARGTVGLDAYRAAALNDPMLADLASRIAIEADGNTDANALRPQRVELKLKNGASHSIDLPFVYGAPEDPMRRAEQIAKFMVCAQSARVPHTAASAQRFLNAVQALPNTGDVRDLVTASIPA